MHSNPEWICTIESGGQSALPYSLATGLWSPCGRLYVKPQGFLRRKYSCSALASCLNVGEPGTFSRPYALGVAVSQAVEVIALSCASMSCNHHDLWRSITLKNGSPNYLFIMFGLRKYLLLRALYLLLGSEIFSSTCFISTASYHLLTLHQKEKAVGFRCGG